MKTVMLVDDSEADLLFSRIIVGRSGICEDVLAFDSATAALAHLQAPEGGEVDLILLDINMPGMDGFQFLQAYDAIHGARQARAVVVMLTSSPDPHDRAAAERYACVRGYVVKPINLACAQGLDALVAGARTASG
jgi:CheY-like chemotaxis protein